MRPQPTVWDYLDKQWPRIQPLVYQQIELVTITIAISAVTGIVIGALVWNRPRLSALVIAGAAAMLQVPSIALLGLLIAPFGIGWTNALIALVLYAQLPIIRNTVTGLQSVDAGILESARGIGMGDLRRMTRIHLPLAWPVILAGLRVATMLTSGIAAVASYVSNLGLGNLVFTGESRLGAANSVNQALVGTVGIAVLALAFDALFVIVQRLTVPRGIRV